MSLASFKPRPVIARTALITLTLLAPKLVITTSNSVCSAAASPPAAPAAAAAATGAAAVTPNFSSIASIKSTTSTTVILEIASKISSLDTAMLFSYFKLTELI